MALETRLLQKMGQNLLMTPQLQQAIKLLQLDRLEYEQAIKKEMIENPVLEEIRDEQPDPSGPRSPMNTTGEQDGITSAPASDSTETGTGVTNEAKSDWDDYSDSFTDFKGNAPAKKGEFDNDRAYPEIPAGGAQSLEAHILDQVRLGDFTEQERTIAQFIVGNLDDDGYLQASSEEVARAAQCEIVEVDCVIDTLRFFDPPGICTRSLKECLLTQLESMGLHDSLAARIVNHHLEHLERRKIDQIVREESVSIEAVAKAVALIRTLHPRPGRMYADDTTRYIVPDVYVYKVGQDYVTVLNEEGIPKLRVSPTYENLLKDSAQQGSKAYLHEKVRSANWLIRSIHQRQQTILKVTQSIMRFQRDFLDHGVDRMKPLVLKEVADDIGMHESTVSRVTTEKYVHTAQGVFELKFFFTSGIKTSSGNISSFSVKERIRQIISEEAPKAPVSDQEIVEILKKEKIDIARRTVAKYRETLGISSSSQRKKLF